MQRKWPGGLVDAGLGLLFVLALVGMAAQYAAQGRVWWFDAAVGAAVCLVALGRERAPGAAAFLGLAVAGAAAVTARLAHFPGEPGPCAVLGLLVLGGAAARTLAWRQAVAVALAGLALMGAGLLLSEAPSTPFRVGVEVWVLALASGLGLRFLDFRRRAAAEAVRQEERLALARELHDVVAHHVTGIVVQAQAARIVARRRTQKLDGTQDRDGAPSLDDTLAGIEEAGGDALAAMRRVVGLLRDADDGAGTAPTTPGLEQLEELVRRFEGHGPAVTLRLPDTAESWAPWPPEVATTVHRVVQEALTNIARHAPHARAATVDIAQGPDSVTVAVTDEAAPGHTRQRQRQSPRERQRQHGGGYGLIGMRERVEALGGRLSAGPGSGPDAGWSVRASLPVPNNRHRETS